MAKDKNKFQLNKGGDHNFDISKGGKRKFDLTKDNDDDPIVNAEKPNTPQSGTHIESNPIEESSKSNKSWILILLGLIVIAILAWILIPTSNDSTDEVVAPENDEVVTTTPLDDDTVDSDIAIVDEPKAEELPSQDVDVTVPKDNTPTIAVPRNTNTNQPISTSNVSNDIDAEAMKVIRGEYGVGQERKDNLGANYQAIQHRVNELKREGVF